MICLVSVYRFHSEEMSYCIPESLFFSLGLCGGTALLFSQWRCKYNGNIQHDIDSYNYILTVIPKENVQNYNHNDTGWMQECFTILVFYYIGVLLYCFLGQIKHSWANLSYHRKCFFPNQVKSKVWSLGKAIKHLNKLHDLMSIHKWCEISYVKNYSII